MMNFLTVSITSVEVVCVVRVSFNALPWLTASNSEIDRNELGSLSIILVCINIIKIKLIKLKLFECVTGEIVEAKSTTV